MFASCGQRFVAYQSTSVSAFFNKTNAKSEIFDKLFGLGEAGADLGALIAESRGDHEVAQKWSDASDVIGVGGGVLGATRMIFPLERLVTGKMFVDDKGERRHALDIAIDAHVLAARTLTLTNWVGARGAYKLGAHSNRMTAATMGLWISCLTFCIANNVRQLSQTEKNEEKIELVAESVCFAVDIAALPFDFGYVKGPAPLRITGIALRMLSSIMGLAKEAVFYKETFRPQTAASA